MKKSKEKKNRILIATAAILLGVILSLLILYVFHIVIEKSQITYKENQNLIADVMMQSSVVQAQKDGSDLKNNIISNIKERFPTSSSMYCVLAKNDDIVFLKDENTTSTLIDEKISSYFDKNNVNERDKETYIISTSKINYENEIYTLVICTKQNYFLKKLNLYEIRLYCLGYFILYGAILLVIIIFSFYQLGSKEKSIFILDNEIKSNRLIIDKLENDKKKNYVNSEKEEHYSFYNRSIVNEVIVGMTDDEKDKCIQVDIIVENLKMEHFVLITAILGRIKAENSIACYWEDNLFKVLLFQTNEDEVQEFIKLFVGKYKMESEERVEELKIISSRLMGGLYEI